MMCFEARKRLLAKKPCAVPASGQCEEEHPGVAVRAWQHVGFGQCWELGTADKYLLHLLKVHLKVFI